MCSVHGVSTSEPPHDLSQISRPLLSNHGHRLDEMVKIQQHRVQAELPRRTTNLGTQGLPAAQDRPRHRSVAGGWASHPSAQEAARHVAEAAAHIRQPKGCWRELGLSCRACTVFGTEDTLPVFTLVLAVSEVSPPLWPVLFIASLRLCGHLLRLRRTKR